jgi:2-methylcitrate dehydratase PrpD
MAQFIADATWDALPAPVQRKARMALLDILGATLAGTLTPISRLATNYAVETWPGDEATILLHGQRASAIGAAFANGYAANGLDIDDCALYTKGHPGAQIFPTALALAEKLGLSGSQMMTALVVGYEVAHRTARLWHDHHAIYQACGSWGSVACAAVACHLMSLSPERIKHALGIAEYHAPNLPMMRDIDHPAMVKHGIGWGAMNGIISAQLAQRGFSGIPSILGFERYRDWVADIGQRYIMVDGVIFKEYACCAWAHPVLDAARVLRLQHDFEVDDIAHVQVEGFHETVRLGTKLPTTTEEAQFNLAWPLAVFLLDGEIGPDQILEHRFDDERVRALVGKIELVESDELNELYRRSAIGEPGGKYAAVVTITLRDGQQLTSGMVESGIRYPQGWDESRVEEKFRWLVGHVLEEARIEPLVDMVWHFEDVDDVHELTQFMSGLFILSSLDILPSGNILHE